MSIIRCVGGHYLVWFYPMVNACGSMVNEAWPMESHMWCPFDNDLGEALKRVYFFPNAWLCRSLRLSNDLISHKIQSLF